MVLRGLLWFVYCFSSIIISFIHLFILDINLTNLKIFSSNMGFGLTKYGCNLMGRSWDMEKVDFLAIMRGVWYCILFYSYLLYGVSIPQNMAKIRWVDREILTNKVKGTFSTPLRCTKFDGIFRTNFVLKQYNILI